MVSTERPWSFGESPLPDQVEFTAVVRDLVGTVLSLECSSEQLDDLNAALREAQRRLAEQRPRDPAPRIGKDAGRDQRVYIDHSRDVGSFNPFFPVYELRCADDAGEGFVEFPVAYEGPPGLVHGGFLAVFFDCVLQQLNCDLGLTGKTSRLLISYRRPTPLLTRLEVHARRKITGGRITSEARLDLGGTVLCDAQMTSAVGDRGALPVVSPRRGA